MRHIEIHTIETEADSMSAFSCGLIPEPFLASACAGCGDSVGVLVNNFEPYVVVLEDEDEWYLCLYCSEAVTDPDEAAPYVNVDDEDRDIEPFLF